MFFYLNKIIVGIIDKHHKNSSEIHILFEFLLNFEKLILNIKRMTINYKELIHYFASKMKCEKLTKDQILFRYGIIN
jgi:hypothetical protein